MVVEAIDKLMSSKPRTAGQVSPTVRRRAVEKLDEKGGCRKRVTGWRLSGPKLESRPKKSIDLEKRKSKKARTHVKAVPKRVVPNLAIELVPEKATSDKVDNDESSRSYQDIKIVKVSL